MAVVQPVEAASKVTPSPSSVSYARSGAHPGALPVAQLPTSLPASPFAANAGPPTAAQLVAAQTSRLAYRGLNAQDALALASRSFRVDAAPAPDPVTQGGDKLLQYLSPDSAVASTPTGQHLLVSSSSPLAAADSTGRLQPLSLGLVDRGSGALGEANPAVSAQISKVVSAGVSFANGFSVSPRASDPSVDGQRAGGSVFYAGVSPATDFVWRPTPQGVEASWVLRSQDSPTDQTLQFTLPTGAALQPVSGTPGAARIVEGDAVLGTVTPPMAEDASGRALPTSVSLAGDAISVHVDTSGTVEFPVLIDPQIQAFYGGYANTDIWPEWWSTNSTCMGPIEYGNLLQYQDNPAQCSLGAGGQDGWVIDAPGSAYIARVDIQNVNHQPANQSEIWGQIFGGGANDPVWTNNGTVGPVNGCPGAGGCGQFDYPAGLTNSFFAFCASYAGGYDGGNPGLCNENTGGVGFELGLDMLVPPSGQTVTNYENMSGAAVVFGQNTGPSITGWSGLPSSSAWTAYGPGNVQASATDPGLGITEMDLYQVPPAGGANTQNCGFATGPCDEAPWNVCPSGGTAADLAYCPTGATTGGFNTSGWVSGVWQVGVRAWDPIQYTPVTDSQTLFIDHDQPSFPASPTWSAASGATPATRSGQTWITDGVYNVTLSASDGSGAGASARAGVQTMSYYLDGALIHVADGPCPAPPSGFPSGTDCGQSYTATIRGASLAQGQHTITVSATTYTGIASSTSYTFYVHHAGSTAIGPGSVNLQSGAFSTSATDVSLAGPAANLTVKRSYSSVKPVPLGAFGTAWMLSLPGAGSQWASLTSGVGAGGQNVQVTDATGTSVVFTPNPQGGFLAPAGYTDLSLNYNSDGSDGNGNVICTSAAYVVSDESGNSAVFCLAPGGSTSWVLTETSSQSISNWNVFVNYETVTNGDGASVVVPKTETVGELATPADCQSVYNYCRSLLFNYATSTTASGTGSGQWGSYTGQLSQIEYQAYNQAGTQQTIPVEDYTYDSNGVLRGAWDPRVTPSALETTYGYDSSDTLLTSITPPGLQPWTLTYGAITQDPTNTRRLLSVGRFDPSPTVDATATWTVAYGVPLTGTGAPNAMGASDVANWAQTDDPGDGTAIFPPDEVPTSRPPANYSRATIYYVDGFGRVVNVAQPGGRISTSEYDQYDNVIRALTAADRQEALNQGLGAASAAEAKLLDTEYTYIGETYTGQTGESSAGQTAECDADSANSTLADGSELCDVLGPQHQVQLANGTLTLAREHTAYSYDAGEPSGGPYRLATSVSTGAAVAGQADQNTRVTTSAYSGQSNLGWTLRKTTAVTTDTGGLNLESTYLYDPTTGTLLDTRQPANPSGGDAHDTQTVLYEQQSPVFGCNTTGALVGLPCVTQPAAQPGTSGLPSVPVKAVTAYNIWNEPLTATSTSGSATRTATSAYDAAGRLTSKTLASTAGTALPTVTYAYSPTTGQQTTVSTTQSGTTKTLTTGYDALGRIASYADADGNARTTTYDIDGRVHTAVDAKGTQTYSYDPVTGDLTSLADSAAGTFTAGYNAGGILTSEQYPNGLQAEYTINEVGQATALSYVKMSNCTTNCTWLADSITPSIYGQALTHQTTISTASAANQPYGSQVDTYDNAGRLTQVQDTAPAGLMSAEYPIPSAGSATRSLALGADGNVWFTEYATNRSAGSRRPGRSPNIQATARRWTSRGI